MITKEKKIVNKVKDGRMQSLLICQRRLREL